MIFISRHSSGSHAAAGEITYRCLLNNQAEVTVNLFSDCGSANQQIFTTLDITIQSLSCSYSGTQSIPLLSGSGVEIQAGQYPPCGTTSCNNGSAYGLKKYVYQGIISLPQPCTDWKISTELVTRNTLITTVNNPSSYSLYLEAWFDNLNYPNNSSPVFSTAPVSQTCLNQPFTYSGSQTDAENDSLAFSLINARGSTGPGNPVVTLLYSGSFSAANPMSSTTGVVLNSQTGILSFIPSQIQVGVVTEEIQEFRNGNLIGAVTRDLQIYVGALCNIIPDLQNSTLSTLNCNDSILDFRLDQQIQCSSLDADGSVFRLLGANQQAIPISSASALNCTSGLTDHIQLVLNSRLRLNGSYYLWTKRGNDGNTLLNRCGNEMAENDTLTFTITDCFESTVDLLNVSVSLDNNSLEITWAVPPGVNASNFVHYILYRRDYTSGAFYPIDTITQWNDTSFTDSNFSIPTQWYEYAVQIEVNTGYVSALSDTIGNIALDCTQEEDSTYALRWTNYSGWPNPVYEIMQYDSNGVLLVADPNATSLGHYTKPARNGIYYIRIRTISGNPPLVSLSNWCELLVQNTEVIVPNIITPNGDKKNDKFVVQNLEQYPNSRLVIYNRWGNKVFENSDYQNDWDGKDLSDGTYYFILFVADTKRTEHKGTLTILRN